MDAPPPLGLPVTVLLHHLVDGSERYKSPAADQGTDKVPCGDSPPQEPLAAPGILRRFRERLVLRVVLIVDHLGHLPMPEIPVWPFQTVYPSWYQGIQTDSART
jgi:hypothetical protein